jgi:hypothetical protein
MRLELPSVSVLQARLCHWDIVNTARSTWEDRFLDRSRISPSPYSRVSQAAGSEQESGRFDGWAKTLSSPRGRENRSWRLD